MKASRVLPLAFVGAAIAQDNESNDTMSLVDVLEGQDNLSVLGELLSNNSAIVDSLSEASNFTLLAPSNEALTELLESSMVTEAEDLAGLVAALLMYHVLNGTYMAANVSDTPAFIPTMLDNSTYSNVTGAQVVEAVSMEDDEGETTVSFYSGLKKQVNVTEADIEFEGGVIHIINGVLSIPMNLTATAIEGSLSAVVGALNLTEQASAVEGLEDVTIFAPNNEAFGAIASIAANLSTEDLADILEYHVIEGTVLYSSDLSNGTQETLSGGDVEITIDEEGGVWVNSARVVRPDVLLANGVLHVIDNVLNPNATEEQNEPNPDTTMPAFSDVATATESDSEDATEIPFTSGVPAPSETDAEDLNEEDGEDEDNVAPRASAAVAMGALFGGAALMLNL